jgi:hypothetical protein
MPDLEFVLKYEPKPGIKSPTVFFSGTSNGKLKTTHVLGDALRLSLNVAVAMKKEPLVPAQQEFFRPAQVRVVYSVVEWKTGEEVTDKNMRNFQ